MAKPSIHPRRWQPPKAPARAKQRQSTLRSELRVFDLPGGHPRLTTPAVGVKGVWVNGVRLNGEALPGRLLRDFSG